MRLQFTDPLKSLLKLGSPNRVIDFIQRILLVSVVHMRVESLDLVWRRWVSEKNEITNIALQEAVIILCEKVEGRV